MVERGEVALDDPVRKYLPPSVMVPSRRGREISLVDLATHTSGLPRDTVDVDLNKDDNPYTTYAASDLYGFLDGTDSSAIPARRGRIRTSGWDSWGTHSHCEQA